MHTRRTHEVPTHIVTNGRSVRAGGSFIAFLVIAVQLLLPLAPLFANEEVPAPPAETIAAEEENIVAEESEATPEPAEAESVDEVQEEPSLPLDTEEVPITETTDSTDTEEQGLEAVESPEVLINDEAIDEIVTDTVEETTDDPGLPAEDTTAVIVETTESDDAPSSTPDVIVPDTEVPSVEETPTPPLEEVTDETPTAPLDDALDEDSEVEVVVEEDNNADISTSTEPTVVVPELHQLTNDENRFTFGVNDCARVADGSFYCKSEESTPDITFTDRVFAGPDIDGDNEIYIEKDGEVTQITHNLVDDAAPYFDSSSETLVWHRLVDARYQIVSYDLDTREEEVLTNDHYNNMQPSRSGGITVWQGWVGNDWEILLMENGEISMITDNTVHDIGPRINDDYILWQSEEADGWKVRVYNRLTKETETIEGADGSSIENPRFVLLYDAKQQNGDVETRGYDIESKKSVPLSAEPNKIPDEIPDPDQTGEDRALIINTTQLKTKTEEEGEPDAGPIDSGIDTDTSTSTATSTDDVVIPPFGADVEEPILVPEQPATTTSPDLIIEPLVPDIVLPDIEDLVIPQYVEVAEELDSQDTVATSS